MAGEFKYFEKDGAYFRKQAASVLPCVDEVRHGDSWVRYEGDRLAPVYFGDEVDESEATDGMGGARRKADE